ncbi:YugN family protein [Paenibacillus koleovorans]|uniref:YugN family protein n=1 Tax=Paenibacillus koleovorans TaxID=121608 RepID=UPI000FD994E2|nr:YugN family protein [Paenibacillus koleovorans]
MKMLASSLENRVDEFDHLRNVMQEHQFTLGGNWDYDHGCYDRYLDEAHQVWLRVPFQTVSGRLDGESASNPDTSIRIGTPYVLKHVYNEGLDEEAQMRLTTALIDQFQEPVNSDAPVEDHWVEQAAQVLQQVERDF